MPPFSRCAHTAYIETNWFDLSFHFKRCKRKINESNPYRMHCFSLAPAVYLGCWHCLRFGCCWCAVFLFIYAWALQLHCRRRRRCHISSKASAMPFSIICHDVVHNQNHGNRCIFGSLAMSVCLFVKCWHIVSRCRNISAPNEQYSDMIEVCVYVYRNN